MGLVTTAKAFGRLTILASLTLIIIVTAIFTEIFIDRLTSQTRDLQHLFKHSLGNIGSLMVFLSLAGYMIKRRWKSFPGMLKDYLQIHQLFATMGALMVAVHSGAHFKAVLPVATSIFMLVCLVSGFVGRFVFMKAKKEIAARKEELRKSGIGQEEIEEKLVFATSTANTLANWRKFHQPFAELLLLLLLLHIVSALFFGG